MTISTAVLSACATPTAPSNPPPTPTSTPTSCIPTTVTKYATPNPSATNDISSVTIQSGTYAENDPGGNPWCNTGVLNMTWVDIIGLINKYGCFASRDCTIPTSYDPLAAYDVQPSPISFPTPSPRPNLIYDLDASPTGCVIDKVTCNFEIYQLKEPIPDPPEVAWRAVGDAQQKSTSSSNYAEGDIDHFSTFALVRLPPPGPVNPPATLGTVVASKFLAEPRGSIRVAFAITSANPNIREMRQTRVFRFNLDKEPKLTVSSGTPPQACLKHWTIAQQLTCLFSIGMQVNVIVGNNSVEIASMSGKYAIKFSASVQIF